MTDPMRKTYFGLQYSSQVGDKMDIETPFVYNFFVRLSVEDVTDPFNTENCNAEEGSNSYESEVDKQLASDLLPTFGCIPPWLSASRPCNGIYTKNSTIFREMKSYGNFFLKYTQPSFYREDNAAQKAAKKPCLQTQVFVERKSKKLSRYETYGAYISVSTDVKFKKKVVAYDVSNFVVDVGSSLGLWLGLSILSISEAVIDFVWTYNFRRFLFKRSI